jgi:hypothetical protein
VFRFTVTTLNFNYVMIYNDYFKSCLIRPRNEIINNLFLQFVIVRIEGGEFDGLMIQSRVGAGGEVLHGGVGLIGQFRYLPYLFEYSPCFGLPYATVVDKGRPVKLSNVSFIWTAPDAEAGDIRFM